MDWEKTGCLIGGVATFDCLNPVLNNVIYAAFVLGGVVALFIIIFSGIRFVLSEGDPKQLEGARKVLTYAIIGFVIILISFVALNLISKITGVECIKFFGIGACP